MISIRLPARLSGFLPTKFVSTIGGLILLFAMPLCIAQNPASPNNGDPEPPPPSEVNEVPPKTSPQELARKSGREMAQADAAELSTLANQLRAQLHKMNVYVFSLEVVEKTEAIEKLVKKIKAEGNEH
jgi:hypothetical protein